METDCFDKRYYWLNRKLLISLGQWPYEYYTDRAKRWLVYLCITLPMVLTQVAKIITSDMSFDLWIEIFADQVFWFTSAARYFTITAFNGTFKALLDSMQMNWKSLLNEHEYNIFNESAEKGRLYVLHYGMFVSFLLVSAAFLIFTPPLMKIHAINDSYPLMFLYPAEYFIDQRKYYYLILMHMGLIVMILAVGAVITDMLYMIIMYHTIGLFKIACFRLEHAFDNCMEKPKYTSGRSNACERVARAVESHRNAVRFCDDIVTAYEWSNLVTLLLVLISVTATLYWAIISRDQEMKMMYGLILSVGQIFHLFTMDVSAQRMTDSSAEIIFKAYDSQWYMGQAKEQSLVLLTMQRGLRPSAMVIGKMYTAALENFAAEVKASFSYFTVLISLK